MAIKQLFPKTTANNVDVISGIFRGKTVSAALESLARGSGGIPDLQTTCVELDVDYSHISNVLHSEVSVFSDTMVEVKHDPVIFVDNYPESPLESYVYVKETQSGYEAKIYDGEWQDYTTPIVHSYIESPSSNTGVLAYGKLHSLKIKSEADDKIYQLDNNVWHNPQPGILSEVPAEFMPNDPDREIIYSLLNCNIGYLLITCPGPLLVVSTLNTVITVEADGVSKEFAAYISNTIRLGEFTFIIPTANVHSIKRLDDKPLTVYLYRTSTLSEYNKQVSLLFPGASVLPLKQTSGSDPYIVGSFNNIPEEYTSVFYKGDASHKAGVYNKVVINKGYSYKFTNTATLLICFDTKKPFDAIILNENNALLTTINTLTTPLTYDGHEEVDTSTELLLILFYYWAPQDSEYLSPTPDSLDKVFTKKGVFKFDPIYTEPIVLGTWSADKFTILKELPTLTTEPVEPVESDKYLFTIYDTSYWEDQGLDTLVTEHISIPRLNSSLGTVDDLPSINTLTNELYELCVNSNAKPITIDGVVFDTFSEFWYGTCDDDMTIYTVLRDGISMYVYYVPIVRLEVLLVTQEMIPSWGSYTQMRPEFSLDVEEEEEEVEDSAITEEPLIEGNIYAVPKPILITYRFHGNTCAQEVYLTDSINKEFAHIAKQSWITPTSIQDVHFVNLDFKRYGISRHYISIREAPEIPDGGGGSVIQEPETPELVKVEDDPRVPVTPGGPGLVILPNRPPEDVRWYAQINSSGINFYIVYFYSSGSEIYIFDLVSCCQLEGHTAKIEGFDNDWTTIVIDTKMLETSLPYQYYLYKNKWFQPLFPNHTLLIYSTLNLAEDMAYQAAESVCGDVNDEMNDLRLDVQDLRSGIRNIKTYSRKYIDKESLSWAIEHPNYVLNVNGITNFTVLGVLDSQVWPSLDINEPYNYHSCCDQFEVIFRRYRYTASDYYDDKGTPVVDDNEYYSSISSTFTVPVDGNFTVIPYAYPDLTDDSLADNTSSTKRTYYTDFKIIGNNFPLTPDEKVTYRASENVTLGAIETFTLLNGLLEVINTSNKTITVYWDVIYRLKSDHIYSGRDYTSVNREVHTSNVNKTTIAPGASKVFKKTTYTKELYSEHEEQTWNEETEDYDITTVKGTISEDDQFEDGGYYYLDIHIVYTPVDSPDINTLTTNLSTLRENVTTLSTNVGTISSTLETLNTTVETLDTNVGSIASTLETTNSNLGTVTSNVSTLLSDVSTLQSTVSSHSSSISSISTNVESLTTQVGTLSTGLETTNSNVSTLQTKVDTLSATDVSFASQRDFPENTNTVLKALDHLEKAATGDFSTSAIPKDEDKGILPADGTHYYLGNVDGIAFSDNIDAMKLGCTLHFIATATFTIYLPFEYNGVTPKVLAKIVGTDKLICAEGNEYILTIMSACGAGGVTINLFNLLQLNSVTAASNDIE